MRQTSTAARLALWIGYAALVLVISRTLLVLAILSVPVLWRITRLSRAERGHLYRTYARQALVFSLVLWAGIVLVNGAGHWPSTADGFIALGLDGVVRAGRIAIILVALGIILTRSTATGFYRELQSLGVSPTWRATLLPAALFPKTLTTRFHAIREAQFARGIDYRVGLLERPRILLSTLTLLLLGTLSNIPDRAAILAVRGVYLRDPERRAALPARDSALIALGAALLIAAVLFGTRVLALPG
jgi:hypothetical protein